MDKLKNYQELKEELEGVVAQLQSSELAIDEAVDLYEKGLILITALEDYLRSAENKIEKLKVQYIKGDE